MVQAIYRHPLSALTWRLLWWLICRMDDKAEVWGCWRGLAARELDCHRTAVLKGVAALGEAGLIEVKKSRRHCKVLVMNIVDQELNDGKGSKAHLRRARQRRA